MDDLLEKAKKAVEKYHSKQSGDKKKGTKLVLSTVVSLRKYIEENEREDRGIAQRAARELSEILSIMPMFRNFAYDKKAVHAIHTKKLADDHLDKIQGELEGVVKEMDMARKKKVRDWVRSHPVLGKLRRSASKRLPEGAYVLLFRRSSSHNAAGPREAAGKHRKHGAKHGAAGAAVQGAATAVAAVSVEYSSSSTSTITCDSETLTQLISETQVQSVIIQTESEVFAQTNMEVTESLAEGGAENEACAADAASEEACDEAGNETDESLNDETGLAEGAAEGSEACEEALSTEAAAAPAELVLRPAADGRIFTRFRPKEFVDETRVYKMFRGGPPIVGACIIAEGKLANAIGNLPQPKEGGDQLRLLLSISKEAVGKPGRAFVESHFVLNELFGMCKSKKVHKEAYILLFQEAEEESSEEGANEEPASESGAASDSPDLVSDDLPPEEASEASSESAQDELETESSAEEAEAKLEETPEPQGTEAAEAPSTDDAEAEEAVSDSEQLTEPAEGTDNDDLEAESDENPESSSADEEIDDDDDDDFSARLQLVEKKSEEGRIITRFRSFDFLDSRSVFEGFKNRKPIVGAAIIRERELIQIIGKVPKAAGENQLDTLLNYSRQALDKPSLEFIHANEVLSGLFEQANSAENKNRDASVVLFTDDAGRPSIYSVSNKRGRTQVKFPIADFKSPKFVHDRFKAEKQIVGASLIGEQAPAPGARENADPRKDRGGDRDRDRGGKGGGKGGDRDNFRSRQPARRLVVLAAYGRTPLKQNILLSEEILKRLGVDLAILQEPERDFDRDRFGDRRGGDRRDNRGPRSGDRNRNPERGERSNDRGDRNNDRGGARNNDRNRGPRRDNRSQVDKPQGE